MQKNSFRSLMLSALLLLVLPLALAGGKFPKTAQCPIEGATAKATGKTKPTTNPECFQVEYRHKWTDFSSPLHPERMKHEFWVSVCNNGSANPAPSQ
jgi:hypothetical protein